jgi:hypothetical protein
MPVTITIVDPVHVAALELLHLAADHLAQVVLERAIVALIVDSSQLRQRADETHQRLTRIALEDRGLAAIVWTMADAVDKLVVIEDAYGTVQAAAARRRPATAPPTTSGRSRSAACYRS